MTTTHTQRTAEADSVIDRALQLGIFQNSTQGDRLDGRLVTVEGKRQINYESCSYLGLEMHEAVKAGVVDATDRYGSLFSASRGYLSSPLYIEAEKLLSTIFGRPTLLAPTTTLGHISSLPALIPEQDALIIDQQAHNSIHVAATLVRAYNPNVSTIPHSDMTVLESKINVLAEKHDRIWYALDGLYSMDADPAST
ncbi:hypothetical protein K8O93_07415 [Gordonia bronchialis]|uniref:hypothetical protein n=1 Tax=Gordonia bronchialis TaxID=2054 RepID=UPI001CBDB8F3|nr:hypothetical protein [Gordonia bronchialis]UAK39482.1 hypothetical protein K8O93_07415 [Gordonia bronchialis]